MVSWAQLIRELSDGEAPTSLANKLRSQRFHGFEALVAPLRRPLTILDVGGTTSFWEKRQWAGRQEFQITTLNLSPEEQRYENIKPVVGDATQLSEWADKSFEVVFSNSVIEHLFSLDKQRRMASEIRRVGKSYWVQTPNYWFPIEPHFHVPGWQWMPFHLRVGFIQRFRCGRQVTSDLNRARSAVGEIRLLTRHELTEMFPNAQVLAERFGGLVKSWIVIGGLFTPQASRESLVVSKRSTTVSHSNHG